MDRDRARQLAGEMLLYCFAAMLLTGGYLAFFYTPSGAEVAYDGWYAPLRGTPISEAYASMLRISTEVPGGLRVRQIHAGTTTVLALGATLWAVLGRVGPGLAVLCLAGVLAVSGQAAADEPAFVALPVPVWYALHLAAALAVLVTLVVCSRREAARRPRTPAFTALAIGLTLLLIFVF
ncbi:hypothetical protein MF672_006420 [Actinomadura sp. ATCC 31491]|uniref:Quinol--cytochrome-c reductase n=1 Tax=Actinomadura luzonensis TaxID=2805427 RepID=A0ABT0FM64_9ACTN|nr:hypothetical protein [Actinomadura luzonensis]MCK2213428.1 hypothetical protein [Actinomadura luzonensis]